MASFKPYLACDWDPAKQEYPCGIMPKIDGVRGLNPHGSILGRSLKFHANRHLTSLFSRPQYQGFDGELAAGDECDSDLCRKTSSAASTIEGEYVWTWHVFDLCEMSVAGMPYLERYNMMKTHVEAQQALGKLLDLKVVPLIVVNNENELMEQEDIWLEMGYEGVIIRDLNHKYKHGRGTVREGGYLRIKRFTDMEGEVVRVIEGNENCNTLETNELGYAKRSTHQENMVPNGMVGSYVVKLLTVPKNLEHILRVGQEMVISSGKLTHEERKYYFENQSEFIGKITKFKFFAHGMKDKLRIPTHQSFRSPEDMS